MEIEFIQSSTKNNSKFVGIKVNNEKVQVFYPEFLNIFSLKLDENGKAKFLLNLIFENSIEVENIVNREFNGQLTVGKNLFYSYYWLIQHKYNEVDLRTTIKVTKNNQNGRINWKKTLNSKFNVYENAIYYLDIFSDNYLKVEDDLVRIYKYCLLKSIKKLGWLFNVSLNSNLDLEIRVNEALSILSNYLKNTNNESEKILLFHLITIVSEEKNTEDINLTLFGTYNFEVIYEIMIYKAFNNVDCIKEYYPSSNWYIENSEYKSSNLRPDAIYVYKNNAILMDAKYYRYGVTKSIEDLPKTDSLQKQLTYKDHIEKNIGLNVQFNTFLLPIIGEESTSSFEYIGYTLPSWRTTNIVYAIGINFNKLCIENGKNSSNGILLIEELLNILNNIKK